MARKYKCKHCGDEFVRDEAREYYWRHLNDVGDINKMDLYDKELCGHCNVDKWYEWVESNPSRASSVRELWAWATDDD